MRNSPNSAVDKSERQAGRRRWLAAALLAVAAHALAFGFRAEELAETPDDGTRVRHTRMLPLDQPLAAQAALRHWYRWHNPVHFAKPTRLVFNTAPERPRLTPPGAVAERVPAVLLPGEFTPLATEALPVTGRTARSWAPVADLAREDEPPAVAEDEFPRWQHAGRPLPQIFTDPADMRRLATESGVAMPTILMLRFSGRQFFPRILIEASCGDLELDRAAAGALWRTMMSDQPADGKADKSCYIAVFWRRPSPPAEATSEP